MCVSPFFVPRCENGLGFGKGKQLYGLVPDGDGNFVNGALGVYVPCGRCPECLAAKQRQWFVRFTLEEKYWRKQGDFRTLFVTLTYNNKNLPKSRVEALKDWQAFIKQVKRKVYDSPRFYVASENGSCHGRLHFHALLFGVPVLSDIDSINRLISDCWHRGFITAKFAAGEDFNYVSKYVTKDTDPFKEDSSTSWKTIQTCSKRPALGFRTATRIDYVDYFNSDVANPVHINGFGYALPRYLASKVYTEENLLKRKVEFEKTRGLSNDIPQQRLEDCYTQYYRKCREAVRKKQFNRKQNEQRADLRVN